MKTKQTLLLSEATPYYAANLFKAAVPVLGEHFNIVLAGPKSKRLERFALKNGVTYAPIPRACDIPKRDYHEVRRSLADIEEELKFPIQKILFASPEFYRYYLSHKDEALSYLLALYEFYKHLIKKERVDVFFTMGEDRIHNLFPYFILKRNMGDVYLARIVPYVGVTLTTDFFGPFTATGKFVANKNADYDEHVRQILGKKVVKDANLQRTSDIEMSRRDGVIEGMQRELDVLVAENKGWQLAHEDFRLSARLARKISRPLREFRRKYFLKHMLYGQMVDDQKYVYFPFHVTEDAQVRLKYPEGYNQYELVRNICKNLPAEYKLLVKEHPDTVGLYSVRELLSLAGLPNCVVLDPRVSSKVVLPRVESVITINSTVAYEALFYSKPVFTFAKTFHDDFPGIIPIRQPAELFDKLSDLRLMNSKVDEVKSKLRESVLPLIQAAVPFDYQYHWGGADMYRAVLTLIRLCHEAKV